MNRKSSNPRRRGTFHPRRRRQNSNATSELISGPANMFYALHRAVKFVLLCCVLWVGWKANQHRQVAEPALIWYDVWDNGGFQEKPMPMIDGSVYKVLTSQTFILTATNMTRYNVRLMGLSEPSKNSTMDILDKERKRAEALKTLIEGKEVRLAISYENFNNLGGIVFLGSTNLNAYLVRERLAFTDKELVKGFSKEIQYQMLWSKRHRVTNN